MESSTTSVLDSEAIVTSFSQSVISESDQLHHIWNGYDTQIQENVRAGEELQLKIQQLQFPPLASRVYEDLDTEDLSLENVEPQVEPLSVDESLGHSLDKDTSSLPKCSRPCDCGKKPIYYGNFAPSFGDNPVSGRISDTFIGPRVDPSDFPGKTYWIQQGDGSYLRPDPSDVYYFEQHFYPLWSEPTYP